MKKKQKLKANKPVAEKRNEFTPCPKCGRHLPVTPGRELICGIDGVVGPEQ